MQIDPVTIGHVWTPDAVGITVFVGLDGTTAINLLTNQVPALCTNSSCKQGRSVFRISASLHGPWSDAFRGHSCCASAAGCR